MSRDKARKRQADMQLDDDNVGQHRPGAKRRAVVVQGVDNGQTRNEDGNDVDGQVNAVDGQDRPLTFEQERELLSLRIELARANGGGRPDRHNANGFSISSATKRLSRFDERDVDSYLMMFEKVATAEQWPREHWCAILQPQLMGKAQRAFSKLSIDEIRDYDVLKLVILQEYELVPEAYRKRFRSCVKRNNDSFTDFAAFMSSNFEKWLRSVNATDDIEVIKEVFLIEQFYERVSDDAMRSYLIDRGLKTLAEVARKADEYVLSHKRSGPSGTKSSSASSNNVKSVAVSICDDSNQEVSGATSKMPNENHNVVKKFSNSNRDFKICFGCKKPGHYKAQCPEKESNTNAGR